MTTRRISFDIYIPPKFPNEGFVENVNVEFESNNTWSELMNDACNALREKMGDDADYTIAYWYWGFGGRGYESNR